MSKARRGELIQPLPVGLVYTPAGKVVLDPDTGVRQAVAHLFATFTATGSALATVKAFRQQGLSFPRRINSSERKGDLVWGPLQHSGVLRVLHNPRYAGAFFYGRHTYRPGPGGKTMIVTLPRDQWTVLIADAHPGYITWAQFEANQTRLAELAVAHGPDRRHGPPREGPALLQGIAVCGVCGRRMTVRYHSRRGTDLPDYVCQNDGIATATTICQAIPGAGIDTAVGAFLVDTLTPLALETALAVADELAARADQADQLRATTVQRAQHHAEQARRRYLAVDPTNRLVADTLEADWNTALRELADATDAYEHAKAAASTLTEAQRQRISALAADFPTLWNNPATPPRERKRMVRLLIEDVTLRRDNAITVHIRLKGGQNHTMDLPLPLAAWQLRQTPPDVVAAIDDLLDHHTHTEIANILNTRGLASGENRPFHKLIVARIVRNYQLRTREQRLRATGMLTLNEVATTLGVATSTVKAWRDAGLVHGQRYNDHGQMLYHPPGPNPPTRHQGHPALTKRLPAQRPQPTATIQ